MTKTKKDWKKTIDNVIKKAMKQYGQAIRRLGK